MALVPHLLSRSRQLVLNCIVYKRPQYTIMAVNFNVVMSSKSHRNRVLAVSSRCEVHYVQLTLQLAVQCQRTDWRRHRPLCKSIRNQKASDASAVLHDVSYKFLLREVLQVYNSRPF